MIENRDDSLTATIATAQASAEQRIREAAGDAPADIVERFVVTARRRAELHVRHNYVHANHA